MDKSWLLREFAVLAAEESLDLEAARLYLLLLAGGGRSGRGKVTIETVKSALGENFSLTALRSACQTLVRMKLIELPKGEPEPNSELVYRLLPLCRRNSGGHPKE